MRLSANKELLIESGKSILSRIGAYEKAVSLKLEEVTSHDTADILLSQFEESENSPESHSVIPGTKGLELQAPHKAHTILD